MLQTLTHLYNQPTFAPNNTCNQPTFALPPNYILSTSKFRAPATNTHLYNQPTFALLLTTNAYTNLPLHCLQIISHQHQNLEHRPPTQVVPRNVPPEPPPQHAASGPQAQPLCNFKYKTRQGKKRTRGTNFVVCERTASECMYHRKPPKPPPVPLPAPSHELP